MLTARNGLIKVRVYADKPHNIVVDGIWMTRQQIDKLSGQNEGNDC